MADSSDGQDLVIENSNLDMVLEDEGVTLINSSCLEAPSIILTNGTDAGGINVSHYIIPQDVTVAGFEEVVEEVELGSSWDSITSGSSVTSFGQDSGIESDANPDVFFAFVDDSVSPMTLLTSVPGHDREEVFVQKMYEMKDDILLSEVDEEIPISISDKDLLSKFKVSSPHQVVKLVIKEEPGKDILYTDDSLSFKAEKVFTEDEFLQDYPAKNTKVDVKTTEDYNDFATSVVFKKSKSPLRVPQKQLVYHCTECNINFSSHKNFKSHMEDHLVRLQNSCALCNQEFATKSELQDHIKDHFAKSSSVTCDLCKKDFVSKTVLKRHKKQMHSVNGIIPTQSLKCEICSSVFSSKFSLKSHSATHSTRKPFTCKECGATFTQNGSLQVHLRRHRGEKPFKCTICGNNFTRAHSLKVHMKTHTGEKPYSCEYCGACFVTSSHLTVHRRTHTGERPYSCGSCGATFITTSHLNVHRRLHNTNNGRGAPSLPNPRTISCSLCEANFDDPGKLRHHRRTDHKGIQRPNGAAVKIKIKEKRLVNHSSQPRSQNGCG